MPTCKHSTRKDFVWISPELHPFWMTTSVDTLAFKDHAVLSAHFAPFGKPSKVPIWRQPKQIAWSKIKGQMPTGTFQFPVEQPSNFCSTLADEFEHRASQMSFHSTGTPLLDCQKGRSKTSETILIPESQSLLRTGRHGDKNPQFFGTHMTHKRWFKQLRRLEAYSRHVSSIKDATPTKSIHQTREWRAILNAAGFKGGFQTWWACRPHIDTPGYPMLCPSVHSLQNQPKCCAKSLRQKSGP